jgi:hypothetical protein
MDENLHKAPQRGSGAAELGAGSTNRILPSRLSRSFRENALKNPCGFCRRIRSENLSRRWEHEGSISGSWAASLTSGPSFALRTRYSFPSGESLDDTHSIGIFPPTGTGRCPCSSANRREALGAPFFAEGFFSQLHLFVRFEAATGDLVVTGSSDAREVLLWVWGHFGEFLVLANSRLRSCSNSTTTPMAKLSTKAHSLDDDSCGARQRCVRGCAWARPSFTRPQ